MKYTVHWIAMVTAILLMIACFVLIIIGAVMTPGQPAVLGAVLAGMLCGVLASVFGAIAMMTFQTKFERAHHKRMDELNQHPAPAARYSPADGLE